ncbi:MAG: response regulator [Ectothiorhodospiraceae bacterium]|nr:response regulator [Ectothiorhodospiraceae bacterium]
MLLPERLFFSYRGRLQARHYRGALIVNDHSSDRTTKAGEGSPGRANAADAGGKPAFSLRRGHEESEPPQRPLHILIGEDNPVNAEIVTGFLEQDGHSVQLEIDGEAVLLAARQRRPDVVLLDLRMPRMDGAEVARALRRHGRFRDLPIIAVTAATTEEDRERSMEAGMDAYVTKPLSRGQLRRVISELVDAKAGRNENATPPAALRRSDLPPADLHAALEAVDNDRQLLVTMFRAFRRDYAKRWRALCEALRDSDLEGVHFEAHTLKGSMASFGADDVVGLAAEIAHLADRGDVQGIVQALGELREALRAFVAWGTQTLAEDLHRSEAVSHLGSDALVGRKVLVVEDSEVTAAMLTQFLRREGYDVAEAHSGESGLRMARRFMPDIVLLDRLMSGMDGLEVCRRLRREPAVEDVPVLIITALDDEASAQNAIDAGASDFITKPLFMPVLRQRLRQMVLSQERHRRIRHLAYHDSLTDLPNRALFNQRLESLHAASRENGSTHVLMYLDLDRFKLVNDTCGHQAGDELLCQLSRVLREHVRDEDTLARLGGDEFGVLLEGCDTEDGAKVAQALVDAVRSFAFFWENQSFFLGVSIGVVSIDPRWRKTSEMLSAADAACYAAKGSGRDCYQIYSEEDEAIQRQTKDVHLLPMISRALEHNGFTLFRQQIVPLHDGVVEPDWYELLLRLVADDGSIVSPANFVPTVERYGLMGRVDRWVIRNACAFIAEREAGLDSCYSLNLSGNSIVDEGLGDYVDQQFAWYGIAPERISFEITETATINNMERALRFIHHVRGRGCRFALDDFGAGLSSFGYLKAMPVDYIKIDGGFVRELLSHSFDHAMVQAIQMLGDSMGIRTVAEFAENRAQLEALKAIGVHYGQGFGLHEPEPCRERAGSRGDACSRRGRG